MKNKKLLYFFLSIIALYTVIFFLTSFYLIDYEDRFIEGELNLMKLDERIAYDLNLIAKFPFGYFNNFFSIISIILNPLLIGFLLNKLFLKNRDSYLKKATFCNVSMILLVIFLFILSVVYYSYF